LVSKRFPEAFRRFEQQVSLRDIESFRQLTLTFASWAGSKTLEEREEFSHPLWISQPTWKYETINVRGKSQQRYRDIKTGRFIKKP
jgi:hypothetical protein